MASLVPFSNATQQIDPASYKSMLESVRLVSIVLEKVSASSDLTNTGEGVDLQLELARPSENLEIGDNIAHLSLNYLLRGASEDHDVLLIDATYGVQFALAREIPPEVFSIYANSSADMQVWPYLRELANNLTGRMGLPRLTLPLLFSPIASGTKPAKARKRKP